MVVRNCKTEDYLPLIEFNQKIYPHRKLAADTLMDFRYKSKMADFCQNIVLADKNQIYGQTLRSSASYFFENKVYDCFWGFDFFVQEDKRRDGFGIDILEAVKDTKTTAWGTGLSADALKLHLHFKFKVVGELKKYIYLQNPFCWLISCFKSYSKAKYPQSIDGFLQIKNENIPDYSTAFNKNIVEFLRNRDFLEWRFFDSPNVYAVYKSNHSADYFVVRIIKKMGFAMLAIVDYRCDLSNPLSFESIINAAKILAKKMRCSFVLTSSTLQATDNVLEKKSFKAAGKNRVMVSNMVKKEYLDKINARDFVLVTLADSDGEILW